MECHGRKYVKDQRDDSGRMYRCINDAGHPGGCVYESEPEAVVPFPFAIYRGPDPSGSDDK
jgi:hypothetical protein